MSFSPSPVSAGRRSGFVFLQRRRRGRGIPPKFHVIIFLLNTKAKFLNILGHHFGGFGSMYAGIKY